MTRCVRSSIRIGVERQKGDKSETFGSLPKKPQGRPKEVESGGDLNSRWEENEEKKRFDEVLEELDQNWGRETEG